MPAGRIALGYNAVDNDYFAERRQFWRQSAQAGAGLPRRSLFPDGLPVRAREEPGPADPGVRPLSSVRRDPSTAWDLVLCGDGPAARPRSTPRSRRSGLQAGDPPARASSRPTRLPRWYAHAGAFVLPSLSEPWGLVVNEAAASGLPLLVSSRAGCAATLVPEPRTGRPAAGSIPLDVEEMTSKLAWMASLPAEDRRADGPRAAEVVSHWGPDRFAAGAMEALELARTARGGGRRPVVRDDESEINR